MEANIISTICFADKIKIKGMISFQQRLLIKRWGLYCLLGTTSIIISLGSVEKKDGKKHYVKVRKKLQRSDQNNM